jgi:hypothetical protein
MTAAFVLIVRFMPTTSEGTGPELSPGPVAK